MDVNSGAVHVVDDVVYDAVAFLDGKLPEMEKPKPVPDELKDQVDRKSVV